jgi:hypothetical protein
MGYARYYAFTPENRFLLQESCEPYFPMVGFFPLPFFFKADERRYVKTNILSEEEFGHVESIGIQLAEASEAGECLLRILSDSTINGRSFFVSGKKWSTRGYLDLDTDDYKGDSLIEDIQQDQIKPAPVEMGLFV